MNKPTEHPNAAQSLAIRVLLEAEVRAGKIPASLLATITKPPERRRVRRPVLPGETFSDWRERLARS